MKRAMLTGLAVLALTAEVASAQVVAFEVVFTTVDAVELENRTLRVTGIAQGEMAPRTVAISLSNYVSMAAPDVATLFGPCERKALLAISKPGQYLFTMKQLSTSYPVCGLSRVSP